MKKKESNLEKRILGLSAIVIVLAMLSTTIAAAVPHGANPENVPLTTPILGSIVPQVTETGKVSLSTDGLGTLTNTGIISVNKPNAGATVRKAYLMSATTGFRSYQLVASDVLIDGTDVWPWDIQTPSSISSYNYWKDVTSIVKPKIDAAAAGIVDFTITEANTYNIDGEALVVIFDDPNVTKDGTIILLFGAQNVLGDTFTVTLGTPVDKTDPDFGLDFSLGISYGAQLSGCGSAQYSQVDVNTVRLTTSAGGEDDGACANGELMTVGGIGDSNANPVDPYITWNGDPRLDDELYSLLSFVNNGDTVITVDTINPSNDDNIFFAAFDVRANTANIGFTVKKDFRFTNVNFVPINPGPDGVIGTLDDVQLPAELGELLPDVDEDDKFEVKYVIKPKNKTVSSTNPGQLYGVKTIEGAGVETVNMVDAFGTQFDVNPDKRGGGVEILRIDANGLATILTDDLVQVPTVVIDNTAGTVTVDIDLASPLEADEKLMIYIKYQTALKDLLPDFNDFANENVVTINDGITPMTASAIIEFV